jgi:hypothetical protein
MITFSIKQQKKKNILQAFLKEHILTQEEIDKGQIWNRNYPYSIVFEPSHEGTEIIENLPYHVLVSFQVHTNGQCYAVIRKPL